MNDRTYGGDNRSVELEGAKHGRSTRAALKPDHHRGSFWALLRWEEPEEHVAIVWCIHRKEARVAFDILQKTSVCNYNRRFHLVQVLQLAGVDHCHLTTSLHISTLCVQRPGLILALILLIERARADQYRG